MADEHLRETELSSETVYEGNFLKVRRDRVLLVGPRRAPKNVGWRLLELLLLGVATLWFGFGLESYLGQRQSQGWAFYAASACLFITLGFPGFVWRYLRRHRDEQ